MRLVILALYLVLTLSLSACDWFDDDDDDTSGGAGTTEAVDQTYTGTTQAEPAAQEAAAEEVSTTTENVEFTDNYHHWNPRSWDGKGSSIVLCPGAPKYDSCELNGDSLRLHGNRDYGRWIWTNYSTKGLSGKIICTKDGQTVGFQVNSERSIEYGDC